MIRTTIFAAATAALVTLAPSAFAEEKVNLDIQLDLAAITDAASAQEALDSLKLQADTACSYNVDSIRRVYVDEACSKEVVDQVVEQVDIAVLTETYAANTKAIKLAQRADK